MNIDRSRNATSLKGVIQGMVSSMIQDRLIECEVTKAPPEIELKAANDDKLIIKKPLIIIPQWLTDQNYPCYIETNAYVESNMKIADSTPFIHEVCPVSGHTCPSHVYKTEWICVHNHLEVGDKVYVIMFKSDEGAKFFILDRVPPDKKKLKKHHEPCPHDE